MAGQETVAASRDSSVYAEPRTVTDLEECYFYHSMEIPGYGLVEGPWDLRGGVDDYLGNVDLNGKRVLEVGTASGFLCFTMEGRGADVVAYDLSGRAVLGRRSVRPVRPRVVRHRAPRASPQAEQQLVARPRRVRVLGQGRLRDGLRDPGGDRPGRGCDVRERAPALPRPVSSRSSAACG